MDIVTEVDKDKDDMKEIAEIKDRTVNQMHSEV